MDINILDSLLYNFEYLFIGNMGAVKGLSVGLIQILILIDFVLAIILNLSDGDHIKTYLQKLLKYGVWIYIVQNWGLLINSIILSLIIVGGTAGGSGIGLDLMKSPSTVCSEGLRFVYPLIEYLTQFKGITAFFENPWIIFLTAISIIVILIAFVILAVQIFITYVEFYITATLLLIFIPFGTNRFTSFMAEKAMGSIIAYGVKFMVLTAILAAIGPIVKAWTVTATSTPTPAILVGTMAACTSIAFLSWHIPGMAAGMMTGAPSLTAGNVASAGVAAGAAIVGAGMAGSAAVGAIGSLGSAAAASGGSVSSGGAVGSSALARAASMPASLPGGNIPQLSSSSGASLLSSGSLGSSSSIPLLSSGQSSSADSSANMASSMPDANTPAQNIGHGDSSSSSPGTSVTAGNSISSTNSTGSVQHSSSSGSSSTVNATQGIGHGSSPSSNSEPSATANNSTSVTNSAGSSQSSSSGQSRSTLANRSASPIDTPQPQFSKPAETYTPPASSSFRSGMIASQAQRAIPDEAQPQGSFSFPIKDD